MFWSKYNRIFKINNNVYVIYNYAWNKAVYLVPELKSIVEQHVQSVDELELIHPTLFQNLVKAKIVVECLTEECMIKNRIQQKLSSEKILRLTINPTLDCNLRCWYCYEAHNSKSYMNKETMLAIYKFVESKMTDRLEKVNLSFLGGEPLLAAPKIAIPITQEIVGICQNTGKQVSLHFTTNGTLLKPSVVNKIADLQIPTSFQIAFDGDRSLHNKTKKWGHLSSYDIVLENINNILQKQMRINVRCNYTSSNISSFYHLVDDIMLLPNKDYSLINITLQRVWQEPATKELYQEAKNLEEYIFSLGFNGGMGDSTCAQSYCYADYDNSFVINYNGDVFKCTARDFKPSHKTGSLGLGGKLKIEDEAKRSSIRFKDVCNKCSLLPICTICSQTHLEAEEKCPIQISNEEKEHQIQMRFKESFHENIQKVI